MALMRASTFDILEGAEEFSAVGLLGSRQTGKTSLARLIFKEHAYVSLEDIELRTTATTDPRTFLNVYRSSKGLIIDNFQYVPTLLSHIQAEGFTEHMKGEFILCGPQNSSNIKLLEDHLGKSLSLHTLYPLTLYELQQNYKLPLSLETMLITGLYPAAYREESDIEKMYRTLVSHFVDKDISTDGHIESVTTFHRFLVACAQRVGQVVNITALANDCSVSDHTARRWLILLEEYQYIFFVKPYHTSYGKRITKSPKLYFFDPGLVCSLLKISSVLVRTSTIKEKLFETLLMGELYCWFIRHKKEPGLYFWRDKTERHLACLIDYKESVIALNITIGGIKTSFANACNYWKKLSKKEVISFTLLDEKQPHQRSLSWRHLTPLFKMLEALI